MQILLYYSTSIQTNVSQWQLSCSVLLQCNPLLRKPKCPCTCSESVFECVSTILRVVCVCVSLMEGHSLHIVHVYKDLVRGRKHRPNLRSERGWRHVPQDWNVRNIMQHTATHCKWVMSYSGGVVHWWVPSSRHRPIANLCFCRVSWWDQAAHTYTERERGGQEKSESRRVKERKREKERVCERESDSNRDIGRSKYGADIDTNKITNTHDYVCQRWACTHIPLKHTKTLVHERQQLTIVSASSLYLLYFPSTNCTEISKTSSNKKTRLNRQDCYCRDKHCSCVSVCLIMSVWVQYMNV